MGIMERLLRTLGYAPVGSAATKERTAGRAYAAAQLNRLTADWVVEAGAIDKDIKSGMVPVRSRARDLSQNNDHAKAFLRAVKKNVVGAEGFKLQVSAMNFVGGKPVKDRIANDKIERAFREWSKPEYCTVNKKFSFRKVQKLCVETEARDGEVFIVMLFGERYNKFGFTLQIIEPEFVDHNFNEGLSNGNIIRMGIELGPARNPVGYYFTKRSNTQELLGSSPLYGTERIRLPAEQVIHLYDPERADQTRGISWLAPAMLDLHHLGGYNEAAIVNARVGASKMGFLRDPIGDDGEYEGEADRDVDGNLVSEVNPGSIEHIGNKEFVGFDPRYPDAQFDPFVKSVLRSSSAGLGTAYSTLSNDQREATWSSLRTELAEEREGWKMIQEDVIDVFLNRVYSEWLRMALITQAIDLPYARYAKFNSARWYGRRWYWVDPLKEVQANKEALAAGLKSATRVVAEDGEDIAELYQEIREERELAKENGLIFDYGGTGNGNTGDSGQAEGETPGEEV